MAVITAPKEILSESSFAAAIVGCLGVEEGDVVLDVCAAPGTKTLQLANEVGNGFIYASDISPERVLLGRKDKQRHGKRNINWSLKDARKDSFIMADKILIDAANLVIGEKVHILNINNGERFETYVIEGKRGSGEITINGPASRKVEQGDVIIIISYCQLPYEEAVKFGELHNSPIEQFIYV